MINKTLKNLIIFGAFAFLFISTNNALAYYYSNIFNSNQNGRYLLRTTNNPNAPTMNYENAVYTTNSNINYNPNSYSTNSGRSISSYDTQTGAPIYAVTPTPIVNNYYTTSTPVVASNSNTVTTPVTTQKDNSAKASTTDGTLKPLTDTAGNNLTALSLNGSGGFMPSSVWQWLLVIALILVIIIIARILGRKPAANSPHGVPAH